MNMMFYRCWLDGEVPKDGKVVASCYPDNAAEEYAEQEWPGSDHPDEMIVFTCREDRPCDDPQKWIVSAEQRVSFSAREESV